MTVRVEHETEPSALLIVEQGSGVRHLLHEWVRAEHPDCRLLQATSAAEARRIAGAERPVLVFVNLDMRDNEGFDALRALRTELPQAHLIALSLFHADAYRDYAAGAGAEACLPMAVLEPRLRDSFDALLMERHAQ